MLVSRIGSPQAGQIGTFIGGGPPEDCGGTCVLGMVGPKAERAGAYRHPHRCHPFKGQRRSY